MPAEWTTDRWRGPKPAPVNERPRCRFCGKSLKPHFRYEAGSSFLAPGGSISIDGYGYEGDSHFCGLRCGYHFAVNVLTLRKSTFLPPDAK